jgi:hypothetical protein
VSLNHDPRVRGVGLLLMSGGKPTPVPRLTAEERKAERRERQRKKGGRSSVRQRPRQLRCWA